MPVAPRRVLGVGVAGLTAALAAAPLAHAAAATPDRAAATATHATSKSAIAATRKSASPLTPDYGIQKYRLGVQVADGSYVPGGTTTVGTQLHVTDSGPFVQQVYGGPVTFTCETQAETVVQGSTASFCEFSPSDYPEAAGAARRMTPLVTKSPTPGGSQVQQEDEQDQFFPGFPGDTVTITQVSHNANLVPDTGTATLTPCVGSSEQPGAVPECPPSAEPLEISSTDLVFDDPGKPPAAVDDTATTDEGKAVAIDVTANDDTYGAPVTGLAVVSGPKHGSATVVSGSGAPVGAAPTSSPSPTSSTSSPAAGARVRAAASGSASPAPATVGTTISYTPKAGFSGTDTFTYRISDANGSATARVTVTVVATPPSSSSAAPTSSSAAPSSSAPSSSTSTNGTGGLANTGADSSDLTELALILLATGGVATALGRRRRPEARHRA